MVCSFSGYFFPSRNQSVNNDESNSSSIIFAEFTSEKEKSLGENGIENQNNRLVNYATSVVTRDASELDSSGLLQGNGLADLPSTSIVEHQLPLRHHSDLEENFTSTEESSENLSLLGQTEVGNFPRTYRRFDAHP